MPRCGTRNWTSSSSGACRTETSMRSPGPMGRPLSSGRNGTRRGRPSSATEAPPGAAWRGPDAPSRGSSVATGARRRARVPAGPWGACPSGAAVAGLAASTAAGAAGASAGASGPPGAPGRSCRACRCCSMKTSAGTALRPPPQPAAGIAASARTAATRAVRHRPLREGSPPGLLPARSGRGRAAGRPVTDQRESSRPSRWARCVIAERVTCHLYGVVDSILMGPIGPKQDKTSC
jgi:hypothetical protein